MKRLLFLLFFGLCIAHSSNAQVKIGDNPQNINAASALELESTDKVLVITRVTAVQMNAITPLQGAMVYNTDVQSVHYYDGTQWVNIGGGGTGGPLTADPIVNDISTIVITPTGGGDNLEVAQNSIGTLQIADGGVNGTLDIQNGSINSEKLVNESVTQEKLSENSVGPIQIDNANIDLNDFNNATGFIRATDIVSGETGNAIQIGADNGAFYDDGPLILDIADNQQAITDHLAQDLDISAGNEIQNLSIAGNVLTLSKPIGADDQVTLPTSAAADGSETKIDPSATVTVMGTGTTLNPYVLTAVGGGGGDPTDELTDISFNTTTNILSLSNPATVAGGTVNLSSLAGGGGTAITDTTIDGDGGSLATALGLADDAVTIDKIAPGGADEILRTAADGLSVAWVPLPTGAAAITDATIDGDGSSVATALGLADDAVTTAKILDANVTQAKIAPGGADEILRTAADGLSVAWVPLPTGGAAITDATIDGDGSSAATALALADDAVTLPKIAPNGATADGDIIQWNNTTSEWEVGANAGHTGTTNNIFFAGPDEKPITTEDTPSLGDNGGLIWDPLKRFDSGALYLGYKANGNSGGTSTFGDFSKLAVAERLNGTVAFPIQVVNEGNAAETSTGILFANDANGNAGGAGLVLERVGPAGQGDFHFLASAAGTTAVPALTDKVLTVENDGDVVLTGDIIGKNGAGTVGQVLTTTAAGTEWAAAGGGSVTDTDIDDGLSDFNGTTGYNINVDDASIEISSTDALQLKDGGVTTAKIQPVTPAPATDQMLITDTAGAVTWVNVPAGGTAVTDTDTDDGLTDFNATTGYDINVDDASIEISGTDALQLKDGGVTTAKIQPVTPAPATDQMLITDTAGAVTWANVPAGGQNLATDDLTQDTGEDRTYDLNGSDLYFTGAGSIGIGTTSPATKFHVSGGQVRAATFSAGSGNVAYRFSNDANTGMHSTVADQIGFTVGGIEALRIDEPTNGNTEVIVNQNLELDGTLTDFNGAVGTAGQILSSTSTGVEWINNSGGTAYTAGTGLTLSGANEFSVNDLVGDVTGPPTATVIAPNAVTPAKIQPGADGQVLTTTGSVVAWGTITGGAVTTDGITIVGNGTTTQLSVPIDGINTAQIAPGAVKSDEIFENAVTSLELATNAVASQNILDDTILDIDINTGAAIAGSKIDPTFTAQIIAQAGLSTQANIMMNGFTHVPDYVFQKYYIGSSELDESYNFQTLEEVEYFITKHHHLPGIKSAATVAEEGEWNLGESNLQNLEKIEELFLHTIEQEHKIKKLESENQTLTDELKSIQNDLKEIKALLKNK